MPLRRRLPPEESRLAALEAARHLLIEAGPQAVTLKAVAARIGRTHANLLHHFGSAAELQKALAVHMAKTVCEAIGEAARAAHAGIGSPREVVDLTFDVFDREGGGALSTWMMLSGNENALDPIVETIGSLVDDLHPDEREESARREMREVTLTLVLLALGDALMGDRLAASLGVRRTTTRDRAEAMLSASLVQSGIVAG
jgi:AcrR family transcriptional regulator